MVLTASYLQILRARQGHIVTVLTTAIPGRDGPFDADGVRVEPVSSASPERYSAAWWRDSNARLPGLRYELTAITASAERVFIEYVRHAPGQPASPVAEAFDARDGLIVASRVYHG